MCFKILLEDKLSRHRFINIIHFLILSKFYSFCFVLSSSRLKTLIFKLVFFTPYESRLFLIRIDSTFIVFFYSKNDWACFILNLCILLRTFYSFKIISWWKPLPWSGRNRHWIQHSRSNFFLCCMSFFWQFFSQARVYWLCSSINSSCQYFFVTFICWQSISMSWDLILLILIYFFLSL